MNHPTESLIRKDLTVPRPESPDRPLQACFVCPDAGGPFPGVVILHEIFGLNENIRDISLRFARDGYAALAVDLFSTGPRVTCLARLFYGILVRPLENGVVGDLRAAIDFLGSLPEVDGERLGVIGFCMGGGYALQLACRADRLKAASVFYGINPRPLSEIARACPIVGSYPGQDITARGARRLEPLLERYEVPYDIKIYPGARHSFFNDIGVNHNPDAAADAWRRTTAFFDVYLSGKEKD